MRRNLPNDTDAYKITHPNQYIENLIKLISYGEPRAGAEHPTVSVFGQQMIVHDHFLQKITQDDVDEAAEESLMTFGFDSYFNRAGWEKVVKLGYLPMTIKALPEGLEVPVSNALFTMESDDNHPWFATMVNSLETVMMHSWYPTTIATNCMYIKRDILPFLQKTGTPELIIVSVNDFGLRGATCLEAGARAGAAHLLHARGSDNMTASRYIKDIYGVKGRALSVWATEHSVATSYGPGRGEVDYVLAQLNRAPLNAIVAMVIDSYDAEGFAKNVIGHPEVVAKVLERTKAGGRTVWRPDSGIPKNMVQMVLDNLAIHFGAADNHKGYKVISANTGVIQGDGMKRPSISELYGYITGLGWSADNICVGSGGGLLQEGFTRDTERFAIKACYGARSIDGVNTPFDIQKKPKSDMSKASKSGQLKVVLENGIYKTVPISHPGEDQLRVLYKNGEFYPDNFNNILARAAF